MPNQSTFIYFLIIVIIALWRLYVTWIVQTWMDFAQQQMRSRGRERRQCWHAWCLEEKRSAAKSRSSSLKMRRQSSERGEKDEWQRIYIYLCREIRKSESLDMSVFVMRFAQHRESFEANSTAIPTAIRHLLRAIEIPVAGERGHKCLIYLLLRYCATHIRRKDAQEGVESPRSVWRYALFHIFRREAENLCER